jgi:DNA-directed RNA polymerase subunit RPC12/RpoP
VIRLKCVYCGQRILARDDSRGKRGKCPRCQHPILIPLDPTNPQADANKISSSPLALAPLQNDALQSSKDPSVIEEFPPAEPTGDLTDLYEEKYGFLIPNYDELSLFLMAVVFIILYATNVKMQDDITQFLMRLGTWRRYLYIGLFAIGLLLCLYHVFTRRKKSDIEKGIMLVFAITINAATGIIAGLYMLKESPGWLFLFPVWNLLNSAVIVLMQYTNFFNEDQISDRNATITQVFIGLIAILIIFYVCSNIFDLHWSITYSICIIYTTSFDRGLQSVFPGLANVEKAE